MKHIIQFHIYKGVKQYVAEGMDLSIVTQGKTLDDLVKNIKDAVSLHLKGEDLSQLGFAENPSVLLNFEVPMPIHA